MTKLNRLSKLQRETYARMSRGGRYTARQLGVHTKTMGALAREGLVKCINEGAPETVANPVNNKLWSLV